MFIGVKIAIDSREDIKYRRGGEADRRRIILLSSVQSMKMPARGDARLISRYVILSFSSSSGSENLSPLGMYDDVLHSIEAIYFSLRILPRNDFSAAAYIGFIIYATSRTPLRAIAHFAPDMVTFSKRADIIEPSYHLMMWEIK